MAQVSLLRSGFWGERLLIEGLGPLCHLLLVEGIPCRVVWGLGALQIPPLRLLRSGRDDKRGSCGFSCALVLGGVVVFLVPWLRAAGAGI